MAGKDSSRVIVPGHGQFYRAPVDSPAPCQLLQVTNAPDTVTFTPKVGTTSGTAVTLRTTDTVAARLHALASALAAAAGAGNVAVISTPDPWTFLTVIDPKVAVQAITATSVASTGGGGTATVSTVAAGTAGFSDWSAYTAVGHTTKDSPMQMNRSGGDVTSVGSWSDDNIDSSQAPISWTMAYGLLQHDVENLKLYHGANAIVLANGFVGAAKSPQATEHALFLWVINNGKALVRHYPRVSTISADGENWDTTKLADMPVQSSVLSSNTFDYGFAVSTVGVAA